MMPEWDILGKKVGKPMYELLGGKDRPVEVSTGEMHAPEKRKETSRA
jgi:D-galactarolactone cycloisomerase